MGVECPLKPFQDKVSRYTEFVACCIQVKFQDKCMGTLAAAYRSEISVLDYAINRLDQKDFRVPLRSALDEVGLDSHTSKALKLVLRRRGLL